MKLTLTKRTSATKSAIKTIRREGNIPAVIYGLGQAVEKITIKGEEFRAILRNLPQGQLATTVFELHLGGKASKAIIKDIQYNVASYDVEHIDFVLLSNDKNVTINVPIQVVGIAECPGIKLGGTLRQVIRTLKVTCLPKDIPSEFQVDIRDLNITQSKRLSDIAISEKVRPLALMSEVAVVIAKGKVA
ncbi:MAG: rplY [Parachlamydiales bacterium]|nr:rplY [Parachlamydiales bacterium]